MRACKDYDGSLNKMKVGDKAIYSYLDARGWCEEECTIEEIGEEYITVRISGPRGDTLHWACPECVRVIEE